VSININKATGLIDVDPGKCSIVSLDFIPQRQFLNTFGTTTALCFNDEVGLFDIEQTCEIGIGTIAIMPNDTATYREDSFDNMKAFAAKYGFSFPYVIDETQEVARSYGAQCTPDFFGFNANDELQYRGRLDASRTTLVPNARRDLFEAMKQVAETGHGPLEQTPSMGCSIKWKR
jgi:hypothetical protein